MSFEKALRQMIQEEVQAAVAPLQAALDAMPQAGLVEKLSALLGVGPRPAARRARPVAVKGAGAKRGRKSKHAGRACAVIGCKRPVRSKGYCAAHYQKQRMLERTNRLPADWKDDAPPHSVKDVVLPRGRAGAKALADARKK